MAKRITVTIPHNLTKAEATRRVRDGLDQVVALLVGKVQIEQARGQTMASVSRSKRLVEPPLQR